MPNVARPAARGDHPLGVLPKVAATWDKKGRAKSGIYLLIVKLCAQQARKRLASMSKLML